MKGEKSLQILKKILNVYSIIGLFLWAIATVLIFTPALPYLWYSINPNASQQEVAAISSPSENTDVPDQAQPDNNPDSNPDDNHTEDPNEIDLPELDSSLTEINTLLIPKIGVTGKIHEARDAEKALDKGIWRVHNYGTPQDPYPIILAAHRFGYVTWSREFRTKNSFYNLPKTKVGDRVRIIWNQRRYEYKIYKSQEGTEITDYDADLILYTCKMFNSPVRIFKYAKRVN
jgi:sortase (surface protein transpeptidase)